MSHYLYRITNKVNGKVYIGVTNNFERRMKEHCNRKVGLIGAAINKYGSNAFVFEKLAIGTKEYVSMMEELLVDKLRAMAPQGYNAQKGGYRLKESKNVVNPRRTGKTNSQKQKDAASHYMKNRIVSQETRAKLSAAKLGKRKIKTKEV